MGNFTMKMRSLAPVLSFLWLSLCCMQAVNAQRFQIQPLPNLGGTRSDAVAVNSQGNVVGTSSVPNGSFRAYLYDIQSKSIKELGTLGGLDSKANGINDTGKVVGRADIA